MIIIPNNEWQNQNEIVSLKGIRKLLSMKNQGQVLPENWNIMVDLYIQMKKEHIEIQVKKLREKRQAWIQSLRLRERLNE